MWKASCDLERRVHEAGSGLSFWATSMGMTARTGVFLSHRAASKPFVRLLQEDLVGHGIDAWLDEHELQVADGLTEEIAAAIQARPYLAACFSAPASPWMTAEIKMAADFRVTIVPLLIGSANPEDITASLRDRLYCDFRRPCDYDIAFSRLVARLDPEVACALQLDHFRKTQLVRFAEERSFTAWVVGYATHCVRTCKDATQRYWAYQVLRETRTPDALAVIAHGARCEIEPFARRGAQEALHALDRSTAVATQQEDGNVAQNGKNHCSCSSNPLQLHIQT